MFFNLGVQFLCSLKFCHSYSVIYLKPTIINREKTYFNDFMTNTKSIHIASRNRHEAGASTEAGHHNDDTHTLSDHNDVDRSNSVEKHNKEEARRPI